MRPSNKSRNRNKNNNRRGSAGNNINRVFDSAGPEGRVRGTPQQIIDKYLSLTYDSQLSGDRVAAENFQQHAEHYSRLLIEAQKEIADKQLEQNANILNSRPPPNVTEEDSLVDNKPTAEIDKQEDKIVEFGKNVENKSIVPAPIDDSVKPQKSSLARKVTKKRVPIASKTVEV